MDLKLRTRVGMERKMFFFMVCETNNNGEGMKSERIEWINLKDRINKTCFKLFLGTLKEEAKFLRCYLLTKAILKEKNGRDIQEFFLLPCKT